MSKASAAPHVSVSALHRDMRRLLEGRRDPDYFEFIVASIGVRDRVIGVRVPAIRDGVKQFLTTHRGIAIENVIALMDLAAKGRVREELLFVTFALSKFRRKLDPSLLSHVDQWIEALDNWETCDQLAMNIAADLVARDIKQVERLLNWARSKNAWRRRFALATAAALNQKGRHFPEETLGICTPMLNDPDPQVRKAVGWAIREASDSDEPAAFAYLREHRQTMHPTVLRESVKKLTQAHQSYLLALASRTSKKRS